MEACPAEQQGILPFTGRSQELDGLFCARERSECWRICDSRAIGLQIQDDW